MIEKLLAGFAPAKGLAILSANIEQTLGHPVKKFEMRFFAADNKIDFLIYLPDDVALNTLPPETAFKYNNEKRAHLYNFREGSKLSKVVMYAITPKLNKDYKLDYVIVKYDRDSDTICEAYGVNNGVKEKQIISL